MECVLRRQRAYTATLFGVQSRRFSHFFQSAGFCNAEGPLEFAEALIEYGFTYRDKFKSVQKRAGEGPPKDKQLG
jgi:hypothetical protein